MIIMTIKKKVAQYYLKNSFDILISSREVDVIMYIKNGKRVVEVAIKHIVELPEHISDEEVDEYLSKKLLGWKRDL